MHKPFRGLLFLILTLSLFISSSTFAEETLRLSGVIEDSNPSESVAIINEMPYKAKDSVGPYRIESVQSHQVKLVHTQTAQPLTLELAGAPKKQEVLPSAPPTLVDQAKGYLTNPGKVIARTWEIKALRDLAIINNASVKYYEKNDFFPVSMRQLTLDGFLPKTYETGEIDKYRFYFKNKPQKPDDLELHADPLEKDGRLRFFVIGADAVIREAQGRSAEADSPPHDYPGKRK